MAIGNRYEVLHGQELFGQDVLNVYFYRNIGGVVGTAQDLADEFIDRIVSACRDVQAPDITHVAVAVKNLDTPTDFYLAAISPALPGLVPGECTPAYVTWAFRMNRTQTDVHHGQKRISGVTTGSINDGAASAAILPALATLASRMEQDLVSPLGVTYEPRIMRRLLDAQGHLIGYQDFPMGTVQYVRLSTQNTRKLGVGS